MGKWDTTGSTKHENWRFLVSHLVFDISGFVRIDMVEPHKVVASDSGKLQIVGPVSEGIHPNVDAFDLSLVCCGYGSKEALSYILCISHNYSWTWPRNCWVDTIADRHRASPHHPPEKL